MVLRLLGTLQAVVCNAVAAAERRNCGCSHHPCYHIKFHPRCRSRRGGCQLHAGDRWRTTGSQTADTSRLTPGSVRTVDGRFFVAN